MRKFLITTFALASCILLTMPPASQATNGWRSSWANYYGASASCSTCHTNAPSFNVYGSDMFAAIGGGRTREEVFVAIEVLDSDGGGATNGQEIVVNGTNPAVSGDDSAVPNETTTWGSIQALFK